MLAQKHRFHGHKSVRVVMQKGSSVRGRLMIIRYIPQTKRPYSRCAIIVSKKIFKSAVKRNRIRRRLFEIVRHSPFWQQRGTDMVITIISPETLMTPQDALVLEMHKLLHRLPSADIPR